MNNEQKLSLVHFTMICGIIGMIIAMILMAKHYHQKDVVLERFNHKIQVIFDDEVKDAIKTCRPTISSVPIRHFTEYEVDCDDLSVISDKDVDYAEYLNTRK